MSLPPDAAAALNKKIAHKPHSGTRGESAVTSDAAQELIQVKTPGADRSALKDLPALRDAPPMKREELFVMKLKLCSVIFSFDDPTADKRGKDMKRQTLLELVDYVNTPAGQKIFTEACMGDLMAMVSANVCRALPPATDDFDPEVRSLLRDCERSFILLCILCVAQIYFVLLLLYNTTGGRTGLGTCLAPSPGGVRVLFALHCQLGSQRQSRQKVCRPEVLLAACRIV